MFKDLRSGFQVHILEKGDKPVYKIGNVVSVSTPRFPPVQQGQFAIPQDRIIDLTVECGGETKTYVVSENSNVSTIPNLTLATTTDPVVNEVNAMLRSSTDIINSVDKHREIISECESILKDLNPSYAQTKAQDEKIEHLEKKLSMIESKIPSIDDIKSLFEKQLKTK